ncbi:MAG: exodeoxyribonuclease III [bacterium]|nr:exodeoxyribonuclease III [bacterium]
MSLTIISWNVNGIRAAERKGLVKFLERGKYDIVCLQEVKAHDEDLLSAELHNPSGYTSYFNLATERKGYSGVVVYTKVKPQNIKTNFGSNHLSTEGRVIELEFTKFILLNIYFPNGGGADHRLKYKLDFFDQFTAYVKKLAKAGKPVIFCGDVNVAHEAIDLARPKANGKEIGFLPAEREKLDKFEQTGFTDTFRHFHPTKVEYSWWDQKTRARERNVGWRIDYFWVSQNLLTKVTKAFILGDKDGSDHAPVGITINL